MLNRKKIPYLVLLCLSLFVLRLLPGCGDGLKILTGDGESGIQWGDWGYRQSVTISNSGAAQTDYQVNIALNSGNFTFAHADPSGNDLRVNYNGTSIPYWIESWGGASASVWVKVPSLAAGNTVIYLYFGNAGQGSRSDFDATFTKDSGFPGLAARWHMDEGSGTAVSDSSGNSNNSTTFSATWGGADGGGWYNLGTTGFSTGDSLAFNGTSDYIVVPDNSTLDVSNITIALWAKVDRVDITQHFVSKWVISTPERSYALYLNGNVVQFDTSFNGSTSDTLNSSTTISSGAWYHIAATFNGSTKIIYINGASQGSKSVSGSLSSSIAKLTIGTINESLGNYVDGTMDEIHIFNTALSANEVKALSQRSKYSSSVGAPAIGSEETVP